MYCSDHVSCVRRSQLVRSVGVTADNFALLSLHKVFLFSPFLLQDGSHGPTVRVVGPGSGGTWREPTTRKNSSTRTSHRTPRASDARPFRWSAGRAVFDLTRRWKRADWNVNELILLLLSYNLSYFHQCFVVFSWSELYIVTHSLYRWDNWEFSYPSEVLF